MNFISAANRIIASLSLPYIGTAMVVCSTVQGSDRTNSCELKPVPRSQFAIAASIMQKPVWAEGLVLFGMISIDGIETAYFGTSDRLGIVSLHVGEELPSGIRLIAIRNAESIGQMEAELGRNGETAIVRCAAETESAPELVVLAEPAPTTKETAPPPVPILLPSKRVTEPSMKMSESGTPEPSALGGEDRPAVVPWPRQVRG